MQHVFVTGPARSGTTLMLMLMNYMSNCEVFTRCEANPLVHQRLLQGHNKSRYLVTKQPFGFWEDWHKYLFRDLFDKKIKVICMIRDPRDVAVSHNLHKEGERYFWRAHSWQRTAEEILLHRGNPDLRVIRYEELVVEPERQFRRIENLLGEKMSSDYNQFYTLPCINDKFRTTDETAPMYGKKVWATLGGWQTQDNARKIDISRIGLWKAPEHKEYLKKAVSKEIRLLARRIGYDMSEN